MSIIKNASGRLVEVDDEKRIEHLIKFDGAKLATKEEIFKYYKEMGVAIVAESETIFMRAPRGSADGYGQSSEVLSSALKMNDVPVSHKFSNQGVGFLYSYPYGIAALQTPIKILYTMFESTKIPPDWVPYLEMADHIIVPSKFCQKAFAARGFDTEVIPLGYDHMVFKRGDTSNIRDANVFTFLHYNAFDTRKGWDIVFNAFTKEFKTTEPVRLIFKTVKETLPITIPRSQYPNIEVIKGRLPKEHLADLNRSADCFVFPSRGEGFGLTPLESLACGTTAIIPNASGMSEYFDPKYFYEVKVERERPARYQRFTARETGNMIEVSEEDLRKVMRKAFDRRSETQRMGREGAKWVSENFTMLHTAAKLKEVLSRFKAQPNSKQDRNFRIVNPKGKSKKIAVFMQDRAFYSGGRIFAWQVVNALAALGHYVVVYTNMRPPFLREFKWAHDYRIEIIPQDLLHNIDVKADVYFGFNRHSNIAAIRNSKKYKGKGICTVFDSVPMIQKFDPERGDHEREWYGEMNRTIIKNPDIIVGNLTEYAIKTNSDFYKNNKQVVFQPVVNEPIADRFKIKNDRQWIVMAATTHGERNKGFVDALRAFSHFKNDFEYHIITSSYNSSLPEMIEKLGLRGHVIGHYDVNDVEKFRVFSRAKILLSGSPYEGYGMFVAEALYYGLVPVLYENPVFRELTKGYKAFFARRGLVADLSEKLGDAISYIERNGQPKPKKINSFINLQKQLKGLL